MLPRLKTHLPMSQEYYQKIKVDDTYVAGMYLKKHLLRTRNIFYVNVISSTPDVILYLNMQD